MTTYKSCRLLRTVCQSPEHNIILLIVVVLGSDLTAIEAVDIDVILTVGTGIMYEYFI